MKKIIKSNKLVFLSFIAFSNLVFAGLSDSDNNLNDLVNSFSSNSKVYLFNYFPELQKNLAHISFCDLPTPIIKLENFGGAIGCNNIFMKADYLTGKSIENGAKHMYGGNKPRKLEFLLAEAKSLGKETIITYGCAGSNHALATAVYAKELGFKKCILMLKNQPNSPVVRNNLLLDCYYGAELQFYPNNQVRNLASAEVLKNDPKAYLIPTGGSNAIGELGFINAAFELKEQIKQGLIKEPDFIYIPVGSCGTVTGLLLGLLAAEIKSKVIAVAIEPEEFENEFDITIRGLFKKANELLNSLDQSFKIYEFPENQFVINKKFAGTQYGLFTTEAVEAIKFLKKTENIKIEGTYSSKPVSAIMDDAANGLIKNETVLLWNTFCAIDYSDLTKTVDYKNMPAVFQRYFEEDIQPLSKIN